MDKQEYYKRMKESIQEDNFSVSSKSPLNAMEKNAKIATDSICQAFGVNKYHLIVSNPSDPLMYGLPKVHKNRSKMRKIVSNINSPLSNIARWLVKDLKRFGSFDGYSVKNSLDFVDKVRDIEIEKDEIMISFDVEALFPSIPVDTAIEAIENHLNKFSIPDDKFNEGVLPRIWHRYVDDTFAIVKISDVDKILGTLNSRYPSIKFTFEKEDEKTISLPFLDILIKRKGKKLEFGIYRKSTSTTRYITNDSYCTYQQKLSSFNSMVYRLCSLPLSAQDYMKEYKQIKHIDQLISKHSNQIRRNKESTLFSQTHTAKSSQLQRVSLPCVPAITNTLKNGFQKCNLQVVYTNNNKLRNALGSTKDKLPTEEQSGVYE
ncbi:uncharacterized protein LOC118755644, partial [Rhagoletis pomonella]|uniref:uncharacterized protein LOC118755644 n=1 Tax=Rhagoletis pomonella TaxID=28610 RepID=UPI00177D9951